MTDKSAKFLNKNSVKADERAGSLARLNPYVHLASAVLLQAFQDIRGDDALERVDALLWLTSRECEQFMDVLELHGDPFAIALRGFDLSGKRRTRNRRQ